MTSHFDCYVCVWLDKDAEKNRIRDELRHVISHLHIFDTNTECDNYIRASTKEKIVLVISSTFAESTVTRLHDLPQLVCCYIFCRDQSNDLAWTKQYLKINGVYKSYDEILVKIIQDQKDRKKLEDSTTITLIPVESKSLQSRNAHFLWFLLYIEVLIQTHHSQDAKNELVDICRKLYVDKPDELAHIEQFEREYIPDKAIWWYTLDSCLYRLLNSSLRSRDFDILFAFRFFISDLAHAIQRQYEQFLRLSTERDPLKVFRGQYLSDNELKLMLDNVHEFISMNSFFSTSRQRQTAIEFLQNRSSNNASKRVLFEITIDPRLPIKPFADIKEYSVFATEDEVLITFGALYRIDSITEHSEDGFYVVQLSLASDNDYRLKYMYDYFKQTINHEYTLDSLGKILHEMGEYQHVQGGKCRSGADVLLAPLQHVRHLTVFLGAGCQYLPLAEVTILQLSIYRT